ncbi:hypothetical protein BIPXVNHO_CDS0155 [Staphylococcus phage PG-2021_27]
MYECTDSPYRLMIIIKKKKKIEMILDFKPNRLL